MDWLINENTDKQHSEDLPANLPIIYVIFAAINRKAKKSSVDTKYCVNIWNEWTS